MLGSGDGGWEGERERETDSEHQGAHAQKGDGQREEPVLLSEI